MRDYFLKTADEKSMLALLASKDISPQHDTEGQMQNFWQTDNYAVDLIGDVYKAPVVEIDPVTGEDIIISPAVKTPGYHANLRWMDDATAPEFEGQIVPKFPKRVFAHDDN
jgi:hypothetical protein